MKTTVVGAYPKISDDHQDLRRALHRVDRGELDEAGLDAVLDESTVWAMSEMVDAGIDVVNDGQIRWDDLLAPFAKTWRNCERGPLERFYDNNTYFRQPIISGAIETDGKTLVRDYTFAERHRGGATAKASICGPLTFATLVAEDRHYRSLEDRVLAVADALAAELAGLKAAGATLVDVEEPALAAHPELIDLEREAFARLAKAAVPLAFYPYFFPIDHLMEALNALPISVLGVDVRSREASASALDRLGAFSRTVAVGIVDARNTALETPRELADMIGRAIGQVPSDRLWFSPTTSLEYLPHDVAVRKLSALVSAARATKGVPA